MQLAEVDLWSNRTSSLESTLSTVCEKFCRSSIWRLVNAQPNSEDLDAGSVVEGSRFKLLSPQKLKCFTLAKQRAKQLQTKLLYTDPKVTFMWHFIWHGFHLRTHVLMTWPSHDSCWIKCCMCNVKNTFAHKQNDLFMSNGSLSIWHCYEDTCGFSYEDRIT
jgi:hypothetical protein